MRETSIQIFKGGPAKLCGVLTDASAFDFLAIDGARAALESLSLGTASRAGPKKFQDLSVYPPRLSGSGTARDCPTLLVRSCLPCR
jgi:hypothetical protein